VRIGDADVTLEPPARRPTATVFQDYALFPHLTVAGNVGFGLSVRGLPKREIARRVDAALERVGLAGFGPRGIAAASGGQRQRIALARALITEPSILLLDEPLGALDLALRRQMQDELRHVQQREARTFVHVTHDQEEAMAIADLIVIMNAGRVEDAGPPERVYARPRTRFAAAFLGESTVLDGTVTACGDDGRIAVHTPCGRLVVDGRRDVGSAAALAIRPEAIRPGAPAPGEQALGTLAIDERVFQGSFVRLCGRVGDAGTRVVAKVPLEALPPTGTERTPLRVAAGAVTLLDR
jgi:spermidine/putrescine transport system ATP-binding protein